MATILVVDDRPINRRFLSMLLSYAGHRLIEAQDGAEALARIRLERPDLVISDVMMPQMDGFELAQQVRADPALAATPIIFYTATYRVRDAEPLARACGVTRVLAKPSEPELILKAVDEALGPRASAAPPQPAERSTAPPRDAPEVEAASGSLSSYLLGLQGLNLKMSNAIQRGLGLVDARERVADMAQQLRESLTTLQSVSLRLTAVMEAGLELASERDAEELLDVFCRASQDVVSARFAGVGMLAEDESRLGTFHSRGLSPEVLQAGGLPEAHAGALGRVLATRKSVRLAGAEMSLEAAGLPPRHPASRSFLAVPIATATKVMGWLYLAERIGEPEFDAVDEQLAVTLSAKVALAYENLGLYEELRRQAAALGATEGRLRDIVASSPAVTYALRVDGETLAATWVSHNIQRFLGYGLEEALAPTWWIDHLHPDDSERVLAETPLVLAQGEASREYRFQHADGSYRWLHDDQRLVYDAAGRPAEVIGSWSDVTGRRQAEESERRLLAVIEATPDLVGMATPEGTFLYVNRAGRAMLGIGADEDLLGTPLAEFYTAAEAPRVVGEAIPAALRDGVWRGRTVMRFRGGGEAPVSEVILAHRSPAGRVEYLSTIARDVSQEQRMEDALRHSEARLRAIVDGAVDAIITIDEGGAIESFNPAAERLFGYPAAAVKGRNVSLLMPSPHREEHDGYVRNYLSTGVRKIIGIGREVVGRKLDGTEFPMDLNVSEFRLGTQHAFAGFVRDLTARKALEAQFLQSQKMESVGRLAGGIAHDFNNLLGVVTGYGELLARHLPEDPRLHRYVGAIRHAADQAAGLTRQLLAFSRKQVMQPRVLDLNQVVLESDKLLRRVVGENIEVRTVLKHDPGLVKADPIQLSQVLVNLVVNARDAMPKGGRLTIETADVDLGREYVDKRPVVEPGPYVMLAVSDTGQGMTPDVQAQIFEPFFTTKDAGKGTGLGLSTVYGIVKQSGGYVWVYSEPGQGSAFKVYLPRIETAEAAAEAVPAASPAPRGSETVLLVEDEEALRGVVQEVLEASGYTILTAGNGPEALELVESHAGRIDLLVTDVVLPGIGGRELADRLSTARAGLKVLYISGYTDDAVVLQGVRAEEMAFLQKPFTVEALGRAVRSALDT